MKKRLFEFYKNNRWLTLGLAGVIMCFIAGTGISVISKPLLGSADAALHLDYSWQVYKGSLPVFVDGPAAPIGRSMPKFQLVAQHPPLYYAILAPFTGPILDAGNWKLAALVARGITMLIGLLCVAAFIWAGSVFGGKRKHLYMIALPGIASALTPFALNSSAVYNDVIMVLFTTAGLIMAAMLVIEGPSRNKLTALLLIATLGMLTRASFISVLAVIILAIFSAFILHGRNRLVIRFGQGVLMSALIMVAVLLSSGWFYARNFELSGNFFKSSPPEISYAADTLGRKYHSFKDVVTSRRLWQILPNNLFGGDYSKVLKNPYNTWASVSIVFASLAGSMQWLYRKRIWRRFDPKLAVVAALFILHTGLVFGQQIVHATGYGAVNIRYFLPLWLPLAMFLTTGLLSIRKLRGMGVVAAVAMGWIVLLVHNVHSLMFRSSVGFAKFDITTWSANAPDGHELLVGYIILVLIMLLLAGIILQAMSLWRLTGKAVDIE